MRIFQSGVVVRCVKLYAGESDRRFDKSMNVVYMISIQCRNNGGGGVGCSRKYPQF